MFKLSLNQRLLLVVLVALLPIAIFSIFQAKAGREYSQRLIADHLAVSALAAASDQRQPINAARMTLATLIQNPDVYENSPKCAQIFKEYLSVQNSLINIVWSDPSGVPVCSVLPTPAGLNLAKDEWWQRSKATRDFVLSAPTFGPIAKRRVIIAAQSLFSSSGTHIGTLSAAMSMSWIEKELAKEGASGTKMVGIADSQGRLVMSSGPRRFQKINVATSPGTASTVKSYDGEQWMYSSAPLYENQLHVVYAEPAQPLIVPIRDQLRAGIGWPILAVLMTLLAVWFGVNRFVVRWLDELGLITKHFASGDYSERRTRFTKAPPEIAEVASDLHIMALAITQRSDALEASVKATRSMAREVNHRVKNNLQMIMSLLALQSARVANSEARLVLDQTGGRMAALALVHRLLYERGDEADQGEVDMDRLFSELCQQLKSSSAMHKNVELHCHSSIGNRSVDEAVPVGLLVVEAVTNVYRHAFPDGRPGAVAVSLSRNDDLITLQISDQGVGYDAAMTETSMGTDLIRGFVEQLSGNLEIKTAINEGVTMKITYPAGRIMKMAR